MKVQFIKCKALLEGGQEEVTILINPETIVRMTLCENSKVNLYMSNGEVIIINISELNKFDVDTNDI